MKIKDYLKQKDKLHLNCVYDAIRPKNLINTKFVDENSITYEEVKTIMHFLSNNKTEEAVVFAYKIDDVKELECEVFFPAKNWLIKFIENCIKREQLLLKSIDHDSALWEQAGGHRLNPFNLMLPLVQIGEIYHIYPYDLLKKPYVEIQSLLSLHKIKSEVTNDFNKLKYK